MTITKPKKPFIHNHSYLEDSWPNNYIHQATFNHKEIIFLWLEVPHIMEFWDNTQDHKYDLFNFITGRKSQLPYCDGKYA